MNDLPAILFPHTYVRETDIKRALSFLGPVTICLPFNMEPRKELGPFSETALLKINYPPAELQPNGRFRKILAEYYQWLNENPDRDSLLALQAQQISLSEEHLWEIRQGIKKNRSKAPPAVEDNSLAWNFVLHLAYEVDANRAEADDVLDRIIRTQSLLQGALEEEDSSASLFKDLPRSEAYPYLNENLLELIVEAWLGLFRATIEDFQLLFTPDPYVMSGLQEAIEENLANGLAGRKLVEYNFKVPDLSRHSSQELIDKRTRFDQSPAGQALREMLGQLRESEPDKNKIFNELAREMENYLESPSGQEHTNIKMSHIPAEVSGKGLAARELSGKTILLIEGGNINGRERRS